MSVFDNVAYVLREQAPGARGRRLRGAVRDALARAGLSTRSPTTSTIRHSGCREASSSGYASPARSLRTPRCCCWMTLSALDPQSTKVIEDLIVRLRDEVAIVIVTHNLQQAYRVADHVGFHVPGRSRRVRQRAGRSRIPREQRTLRSTWRLVSAQPHPGSWSQAPVAPSHGCATTQRNAARLRLDSARDTDEPDARPKSPRQPRRHVGRGDTDRHANRHGDRRPSPQQLVEHPHRSAVSVG